MSFSSQSAATQTAEPKPSARAVGRSGLMWISLLALSAGLIAAAFYFDDSVEAWLGRKKGDVLWNIANFISDYAEWYIQMPVAAVIVLIARAKRNQRLAQIVVAMMLSATLAGVASNAVRWTTGRTRPNAQVEQGWYGMRRESQWLVAKVDYSSFPSAHTSTMAGFVGVLLFASLRFGIPFFGLAVVMGWARIALGMHHFSDVMTAVVLGVWVAYLTWTFLMPRIPWISAWTTPKEKEAFAS